MKNVYVRMVAATAGASAQPVMEERIIAVVYFVRLQFEWVVLELEHTHTHSTTRHGMQSIVSAVTLSA